MPQAVTCPKCAQKLKAPDSLAGKRVACPACKSAIDVPALSTSPIRSSAVGGASVAAKAPATSAGPADVIVAACPQCAKKLKAPPSLAGKRVRCPACQSPLTIPGVAPPAPLKSSQARSVSKPNDASGKLPTGALPSDDDILGMLGPATSSEISDLASAIEASASAPVNRRSAPAAPTTASPKPPIKIASSPGAASRSTPPTVATLPRAARRPRFLYLLFALALVPLGISTLTSKADDGESDLKARFWKTIASKPELAEQINDETTDEELWEMLPEGRFEGAHLPHETWTHWVYAFVAGAVFLGAIFALFETGKAPLWKLLAVTATTGTVGVLSLIIFQMLAEGTQGVWVRGRGWGVILFLIIKFIGFSYQAALDPEYGFWVSMMGFTFGVGLCEEMTKVIPAIGLLGEQTRRDWRAACVMGLASGVGFGVAEGIMYSSHYYNGIYTGEIYLIRFVSCVALHAVWAAAAAIFAADKIREDNATEWGDLLGAALVAIAVPAVLHGLYDTLLKREMPGFALVVAAASFAWLAFVVERARGMDEPERSGFVPAMA